MSGLIIEHLNSRYGEKTILDNINLDIAEGEFHVLLGPSGCGKTTLLRSIAGLQPISGGTITMSGKRLDLLQPKDRDLAMVFQHYALFPNMTVRENLAFGLKQKKTPKAQIIDQVDRMLDMTAMTEHANALPANLSGGQRQRVALARALILEPKLLLLDEPLSALDAQIRKKLQQDLKRMQRQFGLTAILVTHDQEEALMLGDRISILDRGEIMQSDTAQNIFYRPKNLFVAGFLGDANIIPAHHATRLTGQNHKDALVIHPASFREGTDENAALTLEGEVMDVQIMGQLLRTNIRYCDLELRYDRINRFDLSQPQQGSKIILSCEQRDIHHLPVQ